MDENQERRVPASGYYLRGERLTVPARSLAPNAWNPNVLTDAEMAALTQAIKRHGFMQEVLVRPHPVLPDAYQVIDGEHRSKAVEALSQTEPDTPVDVRVVHAADSEAKTITMFMNRDRGTHDTVAEAALLKELSELDVDLLPVLPFDEGELAERIALADHEWETYADGSANELESDEWTTLRLRVTADDAETIREATERIRAEHTDVTFSSDTDTALGQGVTALAQSYLGS